MDEEACISCTEGIGWAFAPELFLKCDSGLLESINFTFYASAKRDCLFDGISQAAAAYEKVLS